MPEVIQLHRATVTRCPPCHGRCRQGRDCPEMACAPEGGVHADPAPALESMRRHDRARCRVALALLLAVAGFLAHIAWPHLAG